MKQKKHTINERMARMEKVCTQLYLKIAAIENVLETLKPKENGKEENNKKKESSKKGSGKVATK